MDIARKFKESHNNVMILSPVRHLPMPLEHEICLLDFALPSKSEIAETLETVLDTLRRRDLKINLTRGDRERLAIAGQGLTRDEFENALAKSAVKSRGKLNATMIDEIVYSKKQIIQKSGLLEFFDTSDSMDQIGGLESLRNKTCIV